jgi:hypothetical protein
MPSCRQDSRISLHERDANSTLVTLVLGFVELQQNALLLQFS